MANEIVKTSQNTAIDTTNDFDIPNGYICTLDITEIEGKLKLAEALNGAVSMKDMIDTPMKVTNIVTTPGVRSRTGEVCTNTYLITEDGPVYFSQSDGIARSVKVIVGVFTDPQTQQFTNPVEQGVGLVVKEQSLNNGNTLKTIVPVKLA